MLKKWLLLPLLFYSLTPQAAIVDGYFSDWYWQSGSQSGVMDYNINSFRLEGGEYIFTGDKVVCNKYWKCRFEIEVWDKGWLLEKFVSWPINKDDSAHQYYTLEQFNEAVKSILPMGGKINYSTYITCITITLTTGWQSEQVGSTCDGTLPPPPPPPSVPVFCNVNGLSSDTVDFGVLVQGRAASRSITASLGCNGTKDVIGKGRLLITDAARSGAATATLRNAQSGAEIKVRLSIGDENGSNEKRYDVKSGYQADVPIYFRLDAGETTNKPGYFSGSALLIFDVL
ncbi:hypothetical protein ACI2JW_21460 [Serratia ureilytica]|nr:MULTISPECIES: hypothetical protein [Serratia]MBH2653673.1 hypothetical protein [Serratia ureilytica]MBH2760526.1 hypothetical protein [Serratia ureilytica]MBH2928062.1 hypothetical protein [Serratia ureilytica]MDP8633452.1 hypothetical protein [Serratia marcescens]MDP8866952.1 hypothetical protein [Serratia marcescens]